MKGLGGREREREDTVVAIYYIFYKKKEEKEYFTKLHRNSLDSMRVTLKRTPSNRGFAT